MKNKRPTVYSQSKFDAIKEARPGKRANSNVVDKFSVSGQASRVFGKKVSSPNPPPHNARVSTRRERDDSHNSQNLSTTTKSRFNTIDQYNAGLGRTDSRHTSPFKPAAENTQNDFNMRNQTLYSQLGEHAEVVKEDIEESIKEEIDDPVPQRENHRKEMK